MRATITCTSNMTRTDAGRHTDRRIGWRGACVAAALCLGSLSACSGAASVPEDNSAATTDVVSPSANAVAPVEAPVVARQPTGAPAPAPMADAAQTASRVIGTKDRTLSDGKVCEVSFVYGGREPESIFWEEPCAGVTAKMMDRGELEQLGRWERLEDADRTFVERMPGGKVLYVGGPASASVYPVGTTGTSYEVSVAD